MLGRPNRNEAAKQEKQGSAVIRNTYSAIKKENHLVRNITLTGPSSVKGAKSALFATTNS